MIQTTFPAEWHAQRAILLTWPHEASDWNWILSEVEAFYFKLSKQILEYQDLILVVNSEERKQAIHATLEEASPPHTWHIHVIPSNDTWARDHGPISIYRDGQLTLLDFGFNGWGDKFPSSLDNQITRKLHEQGAFPDVECETFPLILEGGSVETDGEGTLLTTAPCLLNPNRNPDLSRGDIEAELQQRLGVERFLWLEHGHLAGDDTDSHIDTLARFCDPCTIAFVDCTDEQDEPFEALNKMKAELKEFRQADGSPYRLIALPMPKAIYEEGRRLPATYANFLILNGAVLLPTYQVPEDELAIAALAEAFPDRNIIPIDCRVLIRQNGSLHCITMQIPIDAYKAHEIH